MRPVDRGPALVSYVRYGDAKPDLIDRLGSYCSYCERRKDPQDLHVEHIYPKAKTAHPNLERSWRNFLLACSSCNAYKATYLGNGRQRGLLRRHLWPHIDNTFSAFIYHDDGRMSPSGSLSPQLSKLAMATIDLIGALKSPAVVQRYRDLGISYDGISKRQQAWAIAKEALDVYEKNPTNGVLNLVVKQCLAAGYFSIWMRVFRGHSVVCRALCDECHVASVCFDTNGRPNARGRC